jgi:hypothetical protein
MASRDGEWWRVRPRPEPGDGAAWLASYCVHCIAPILPDPQARDLVGSLGVVGVSSRALRIEGRVSTMGRECGPKDWVRRRDGETPLDCGDTPFCSHERRLN